MRSMLHTKDLVRIISSNSLPSFLMNFSRTVSTVAAGLVVATGVFAATTVSSFSDVSASHEHAEAIAHIKAEGMVSGYPDGTFRAHNTINRAEFTKIMVEARYSDEEIDELLQRVRLSAMSDVPSDAWFWRYVAFARAKGIVSGYPDGTFKPAATINFAEAAKIIANTYELDSFEGSVWFEGYVHALANLKAIPLSINGFTSAITRGQMAEIIYRIDADITAKSSHTYASLNGDHPADSGGCFRTGCSAHICSDEEMASTCEWREEYQCYKTATCERQNNGECGWTPTDELNSCLSGNDTTSSCAAVLCPTNSRCEAGKCIPLSSGDSAVVYTDYSSSVIGNGQKSVLFFYASWCPYCRVNDGRLLDWYADGTATISTYKVDYTNETTLRNRYGVTQQDTHVLIDGEGNKIQLLSFPSEAQLKAMIQTK
jgi:hypothetical protein